MEENWRTKMIGEHLRQYYVTKKCTTLNRISGKCTVNFNSLKLGELVEGVKKEIDGIVQIRIKDSPEGSVWYNTEWICPTYDLIPVSKRLWNFLAAVQFPEERVRIASNKQFCKDIEDIRENDKVLYLPNSSAYDGSASVKCLATVSFIGPMPELGDGIYFGLDLQEQSNTGISNLIFAAVNSITPYNVKTLDGIRNAERKYVHSEILIPEREEDFLISGGSRKKDTVKLRQDSNGLIFDKYGLDDNTNNNRELISLSSQAVLNNLMHPLLRTKRNLTSDNAKGSRYSEDYNLLRFDDDSEKEKNSKLGMVSDAEDLCIRSNVEVLLDKASQNDLFSDVNKFYQLENTSVDGYKLKGNADNFGNMESSVIVGMVRPICVKGDLEKICGKNRGIQGHHNSCYLDATLFSMFTFTSVFDSLLFRPPHEKDCSQYEEVQRVLREEIVNPLRKNFYVRADHVMKLRTLLEKLSSISGLTSEEKDPEEFLTSLVAQILNAEPFLKLSSGQEAYHYQLFVEKDERLNLPTVQQLLEQSFLTSNIRLKEVPSCLIIQMPRFGKSFKMYQKIQPTLLLDVTDIIEDSPRPCTVCGKLAVYECKQCYGECGVGLESIAFCEGCIEKAHCHERRKNHKPKNLTIPLDFDIIQEHCPIPRLYLELFAVVCIETSHYVSFVKCGPGSEAPWCFFDSMADRRGEQNGYNIPEMVPCPDFPYWLSEEGANELIRVTDDRQLPEHAKRLVCDAYMCMYQSPDVMMYK